MILKYEKFTPTSYDNERGEEFGDTEAFEYEISNDDLKGALRIILMPSKKEESNSDIRHGIWSGIKLMLDLIDDFDLLEDFADGYEDELRDHFESEALNWYGE